MAQSTFQYTPVKIRRPGLHSSRVALRPMIAARLIAGDGTYVECGALVDSGADACLFPLKVARGLKLDLAALPQSMTGGVGSVSNLTFYAPVAVDLGDGLVFQAEVGFTEGMDRAGFGLLGQQGFFENYSVEFRHRDRIFHVETSEAPYAPSGKEVPSN